MILNQKQNQLTLKNLFFDIPYNRNEIGHPPKKETLQNFAVKYMAEEIPIWLPVVKIAMAVLFSKSGNQLAIKRDAHGIKSPKINLNNILFKSDILFKIDFDFIYGLI